MTSPLPSGRRPYLPGGWRYNATTRDWDLDDYGQIRGVHWVDEGMALAISVDAGTIQSSPDTGNRIREKLKYLGGANDAAIVEACIMEAQPLRRYVDAGQATVTRIVVEEKGPRLAFAVYYRNNLERSTRNNEKRLVWYT
jgi:hypothetical protein